MDRRQLLYTLSALTLGSAGAAFSSASLMADVTDLHQFRKGLLLRALAQARCECESLLTNNELMTGRIKSDSDDWLKEISAFVDQARSRLADQCHQGPAFWQACSDAFLRTAERLSAAQTNDHFASVLFAKTEVTFRQTARLLTIETARTAGQYTA